MSVATLISRLTGKRREQEAASLDTYAELVQAVANDEKIDDARALKILDAADKSADDLARDASVIVQRRQAAAQLAELPALREASRAAHQAVVDEIASFEKLQVQHKARLADLRLAESRAALAMAAPNAAKKILADTAAPELTAAATAAKQRTHALTRKIEVAEAQLAEIEPELKRAETSAVGSPPGSDWQDRLAALRRRVAGDREYLASLRRQLAAARRS